MNIERLKNEHQKLKNFALRHRAIFKILSTTGNPPTSYRLAFTCKGYTHANGETSEYHEVVLTLPTHYPAEMPAAHLETPIFHPNVYTDGDVCLGFDRQTWKPSIPITTVVAKIGNMVRFSPNACNLNSLARMSPSQGWQGWMDSHRVPIDDRLYMPDDEGIVIVGPSKPVPPKPVPTDTKRQIKIRIKK
jgi:ubiquitin-protein ligase